MAEIILKISGTLGCSACKFGHFQPGLLIVNRVCICTGKYTIIGHADCSIVNNQAICTKSQRVILGDTAFCYCTNSRANLVGKELCNCDNPKCQKAHKGKGKGNVPLESRCVCKKKT